MAIGVWIAKIKGKWHEIVHGKTPTQKEMAHRLGLREAFIREWGAAIQQVCPYCNECQTQHNDSLMVTVQLTLGPVTQKILHCEVCQKPFLGVDPCVRELSRDAMQMIKNPMQKRED